MAGQHDNTLSNLSERGALHSSRYPTQLRLIAAIRHGDQAAMRELFILFAPLLRDQARKMSVPAEDRDELVTTLLDDVVMHLMRPNYHRESWRDTS